MIIDDKIKLDYPLKKLFTFSLESRARFFFEAETREDLIEIIRWINKKKLKFFLIGGGSNVVPVVNYFDGIIVKNSYSDFFIKKVKSTATITVGSGTSVNLVVQKTIQMGYGGLEYHYGLPGTVGGAIYMNSKWTRPMTFFGDNLVRAEIIDKQGKLRIVDKNYFDFDYDFSILQKTGEIIVWAEFLLKKIDKQKLKKICSEVLDYRKKTQPQGVKTAGCFFQNISPKEMRDKGLPTTSAGYLIDKSGLKNFYYKGFRVSQVHANFIVNESGNDPSFLLEMVKIVKKKVWDSFGIRLKEEVIYLK